VCMYVCVMQKFCDLGFGIVKQIKATTL
jgi:hypothetical protein